MSDWAALVGIVPDLLTLGMRIAEQHAAARAQRSVAELTHDDLRAAAADLVARSVPVDAILERASGGAWGRYETSAGETHSISLPESRNADYRVSYETKDGRKVEEEVRSWRVDGSWKVGAPAAHESPEWGAVDHVDPAEALMTVGLQRPAEDDGA